ncbi:MULTISPECIES: energy-coupled thiamine transporter ThiT [Butyrivibrio]|uniref:energy-coupled thiamine transporter ThiT n=1 Tax=Butyrivibrio TaxID=830 RepID=UPI0004127BA0|nr:MULTISPECIES: energy-coupled thiamine transporter ThiT [Butyrivibrio]
MNLFLEEISSDEGVVYNLTPMGYVGLVFMILAALAIMSFFVNKDGKGKLSIKQITVSGLCLALAFVLSHFKFAKLPMGGSITLFSMFFVTYIGYIYGPRVSIASGIAYGLLQLIEDPYIVSIPQLFCDYILAFGALGLGGLFYEKKYGMIKGYITGVLGRYFFAVLSGVIFFAYYAPEGTSPIVYSITYNATYIVPECIITVIILCIPVVKSTLKRIKMEANEKDIRKAVQLG